MKWLRELPVGHKVSIIISFILLILFFGLINFWFSLKVMSSVRAYVGGEGLWSKAQKEASNNLIKYSNSLDESDYTNYQKFLEVPLGDHKARLELEKPNPNYEVIGQGFIQGGNSPEDVNNLIFLYRWFRHISYMEMAIQDWTQGDAGIEELISNGEQIHSIILSSEGISQSTISASLAPLVNKTYENDKDLTSLENHFSATLSEGSRRIREILMIMVFALTIILGSIMLFITLYIRKIIIQVDTMKNEFVSISSHELRTPMAAIKGLISQVLVGRYGKLDDQLKRPLFDIAFSADRLIDLTNDLLDVSKIDSKKIKINIMDTDIYSLAKEVVLELEPIAKQKEITMEIMTPNFRIVKADPDKVRQILRNLINNALKFTPRGGSIILSSQVKGGKLIVFIKDSGIGIDKKHWLEIFDKFRQITTHYTNKPAGSGLGLFISESLAKNMGGDIWVYNSIINQGTTFAFSIPLSKSKLANIVN